MLEEKEMIGFEPYEEKLVKPGDAVFSVSEVIDKINEIYEELQEICSECQEFNCDYCQYKILRRKDSHDRT